MAPMFSSYVYEAQLSRRKYVEEKSRLYSPPGPEYDEIQLDANQRHCTLCNIYFDTATRLEMHKLKAHPATETRESLARQALDFTLRIRKEYVEYLKQEIELAQWEELKAQETLIEKDRLMREEQENRSMIQKEHPIRSEARGAQEADEGKLDARQREKPSQTHSNTKTLGGRTPRAHASTGSTMRPARTPQHRRGPSIEILAIIPGGRIKVDKLVGGSSHALASGGGSVKQNMTSPHPQQTREECPESADRYCPICRTSFRTTQRYGKHKAKMHQDFEGDLVRAERKRWEKAERQRLKEEAEEERRQAKARKSEAKGKAKAKAKPQQYRTLDATSTSGVHQCAGCCITFSTRELLESHMLRYREIGLTHRQALVAHPIHRRGVVVKKLLRILREEPGSEWNKKPKETMSTPPSEPLKGMNRMQKKLRLQMKLQKEKAQKKGARAYGPHRSKKRARGETRQNKDDGVL